MNNLERARIILGVDEKTREKEIKTMYHQRILENHPDLTNDHFAERITKLIIEAYQFLTGKIRTPHLLTQDSLVSKALGNPLPSPTNPNYEEWIIKKGFYDFINPTAD